MIIASESLSAQLLLEKRNKSDECIAIQQAALNNILRHFLGALDALRFLAMLFPELLELILIRSYFNGDERKKSEKRRSERVNKYK